MPRFTLKEMLLATTLTAVSTSFLAGGGQNVSLTEKVRRIPIPQREHGYNNFGSRAITTKDELQSFLNDVTQQQHWNRKDDFLVALRKAKIDFQTEVLLLIRTTAGSGSIKISLADPTIADTDIVFRIVWSVPVAFTMDMNYQCFAVTVPRTAATNARIVTELVPMRGVPRSLELKKFEPQIIPLSHSSTSKSP
jgi:hypothetical protein